MKIRANMEFRRFEESQYDFVDSAGKRVQGEKKVYVFLNEEDQIVKVKLPKDSNMKFELHKGDEVEAVLDCKMKAFVDKESGKVNEAAFQVYFELLDIIPFKSVDNAPKEKKDNGGKF